MGLVTPDYGLLAWMLVTFGIVLYILGKFAWKPILNALKARESSIDDALRAAEKTREQMAKIQTDNEKVLAEARAERERLMREAREMKDQIIEEARERAVEEAQKLLETARETIRGERAAAVNQLRESVALLSLEIAEKIMRKKMEEDENQKELINRILDESQFN